MKAIYWYHKEGCVPVTGTVTSDSPMHGICAGCGQEGQVVRVEIKTGPVPEIGEARRQREEGESIPSEKFIEKAIELGLGPDVALKDERAKKMIEEAVAEAITTTNPDDLQSDHTPKEVEEETDNVTDTLEAQLEALSKQIEELKAARKEAGEE